MASRSYAAAMALLFLCAGSAQGQYDDYAYEIDYTRQGAYLTLTGVAGFEDFENTGYSANNSLGLNIAGGYRLHPNFAIELGFEWIEGFDVSGSTQVDEVEIWTLTANSKLYFFPGQVQPFLLLGLGVMEVEQEMGSLVRQTREFAARLGGGIELYASEHLVVSIGASYVLSAGRNDDFDYASLGWGFQYRF